MGEVDRASSRSVRYFFVFFLCYLERPIARFEIPARFFLLLGERRFARKILRVTHIAINFVIAAVEDCQKLAVRPKHYERRMSHGDRLLQY